MSQSEDHLLHDIPDFADGPDLALPQPSTQSLLHARVPYRRVSSPGSTPPVQFHVTPPDDLGVGNSAEIGNSGKESSQPQARHGLGLSKILGVARNKARMSDPHGSDSIRISPISQDISTPLEPGPLNIAPKGVDWDETLERRSTTSSQYSAYSPYAAISSTDTLHPYDVNNAGPREPRFTENLQSSDTASNYNSGRITCPTDGVIMSSRLSYLSVTILVLAVYSTVLSGLWLGVAIRAPRYGKAISEHGRLTPATASLLSTLFAKTIELSFVTVFVAFLGQVLTRRAIVGRTRREGVTIAEMSMRTWIMQPGTIITHWESVKYAALSFLGMIALTAALVAVLYTTASDALVSPKLKFGRLEHKILYGTVQGSFANPTLLGDICQTPIALATDRSDRNDTCVQLQYAGSAFHNYLQYLANWTTIAQSGPANTSYMSLDVRPPPVGILYDNTTIRGSWVQQSYSNITADSIKAKRMINNVTMAMPHANVLTASMDARNNILQPQDLAGLGEYYVTASVPSPAVNVLCAGVTAEEISPLIYTTWPGTNGTFNVSSWALNPPSDLPGPGWNNHTVVSDIFGFSGTGPETPPIFPRLPAPFNTLTNSTNLRYGDHAVYILAGSPPKVNPPYALCAVKAMQYPKCSTQYHATMSSSGELTTQCDDPTNSLAYDKSQTLAPMGDYSPDYRNIASEWANSISLGSGISDGNAANSRLLTQLITPFDNTTNLAAYSPVLPSLSEALAVLAGGTLLDSTNGAPFVHFYNYTTPLLNPPVVGSFNASLRTQDYASGGGSRWQGVFYVVLTAAFAANLVCLVYLVWEMRGEGQVTDYTEPQNLFALAINSPPSRHLAGACGAGPKAGQFKANWFVGMEHGHGRGNRPHFYIMCRDDDEENVAKVTNMKRKKGKHTSVPSEDFEVEDSAAVGQYMKLAARRSSSIL